MESYSCHDRRSFRTLCENILQLRQKWTLSMKKENEAAKRYNVKIYCYLIILLILNWIAPRIPSESNHFDRRIARPLARGNHKISPVDADSPLSVEIWSFDGVPFSEDFFFLVITGQIRVRSTRSERTWNARQSSLREVCDERGRMEDESKRMSGGGEASMEKESRREEAWEWKVVLGKCTDASRNAAWLLIRLRCQSAYRAGKSKGL